MAMMQFGHKIHNKINKCKIPAETGRTAVYSHQLNDRLNANGERLVFALNSLLKD